MKTKKPYILFIAPLLLTSLVACGNTNPTASISEGSSIEEAFKNYNHQLLAVGL